MQHLILTAGGAFIYSVFILHLVVLVDFFFCSTQKFYRYLCCCKIRTFWGRIKVLLSYSTHKTNDVIRKSTFFTCVNIYLNTPVILPTVCDFKFSNQRFYDPQT